MSSVTPLSVAAAPSARRVVARTHRHRLPRGQKPTRVRRQHPQQDCAVGGRAITRGVAVSNAAVIHDEYEHEHGDDEIVEASSSVAAAAEAAVVVSRRKLALATAATVAAAIGTNACGTSPFQVNNVASALARGL